LAAIYGQKLDELAGRSPPPSELERELAAKTAQMMKELDERDRPILEAMASARAAETASNQADLVESVAQRRPVEQPVAEQSASRRTWQLQAVIGGLLLCLVGWMWRQRAR
jgi:hypothetical protein